MGKYLRRALAIAVMMLCALASFYVPFFSDFSGLDSSGNTLQGRRMMSSTHQETKYREPVRPSHSSNPAHSDPGNSPGKPNL